MSHNYDLGEYLSCGWFSSFELLPIRYEVRRTEEKKLDKNKGDYTLQANLKDSLLELWLNRLTKRQQDDSFYPQLTQSSSRVIFSQALKQVVHERNGYQSTNAWGQH